MIKRLIQEINYFYFFIINNFQRITVKTPIIKSVNETVEYIINNRVSVSRFGDGEFSVMEGGQNGFQNSNLILAQRLKEVINSIDEKNIVCIPDVFNSLKKYRKESKLFWIPYLVRGGRKNWLKFMNKNVYYDSLFTRPYMMYNDKSHCIQKFNKLKKIWENRDILIVEGEGSRLGLGNDLFNNSRTIERILCPSKNAFDKYDMILDCVTKYDKGKLILIALGPTATVLAYDLSKCGYQAIDIGHIDIEYEWFLKGVKEKIKIENKYVNEVKDGYEIHEIEDLNYINQIKEIIK